MPFPRFDFFFRGAILPSRGAILRGGLFCHPGELFCCTELDGPNGTFLETLDEIKRIFSSKYLYFEDEVDVKYPFLIISLGSETDLVI